MTESGAQVLLRPLISMRSAENHCDPLSQTWKGFSVRRPQEVPLEPSVVPACTGKLGDRLRWVVSCFLTWVSFCATVEAQHPLPPDCIDCHGRSDGTRLIKPPHELLAKSVHRTLDCTSCHESISLDDVDRESSRPHGDTEPVSCGECHEDEEDAYAKHGRMEYGKDADIPQCWSCHGAHDILPSTDRQSHVHPANLPGTCRSCHADVDLVQRHEVLRDLPIELYANSVHGKAARRGIYEAAVCNDCHSALDDEGRRTAHRILSPADPESPTFHFNIPETCGQCHESIVDEYMEGIHGQFVKRGSFDTPVCTTCHGEHGIISADDPRSPVSASHLAQQTCTPCHESEVLNLKYGLSRGRLISYIDTYHGLKSEAGDLTVANCASCHGGHRILPSGDPTSSIHPANLRTTCGQCHPAISEELARVPIHGNGVDMSFGWPKLFTVLYQVLIAVTVSAMLVHHFLSFFRSIRNRQKLPQTRRFNTNEVLQHAVLTVSFVVLVITGFSLRFSEAWWVRLIFGWEGGFGLRGTLHRGSAVLMMLGSVWHIVYLTTPRGRQWLRDMWPRWRDAREAWHTLCYFLGRRQSRPDFGRFSYVEKFEYRALVWGTVIMVITGLLLWFDYVVAGYVPEVFLQVMLVIHYYEAWLAFLAILIWHLYATMFSPDVYPMNPAWLTGTMPTAMHEHEHGGEAKQRTTAKEEE
jgi:cytochrome b subunit of formate dehydrogenase